MTLTVLATVLLVIVVIMAWRRSAWLLTGLAVLLGTAVASAGGPLATATGGIRDGIQSTFATISATLF
jgi:hypothetical protein